ncbi:MAG: 3'-5' exonuclease [Rhodothermales bacterium]|nr:3'-5' exonuclease [Rhodothermales bacterium]
MILARPIVFFDLEATGLDWKNERIIEIACVRLNPDGSRFTYDSLVNPEREIPSEVVELTGISNEDVVDAPTFTEIATLLGDIVSGADLAGYNAANFDVPMLRSEFERCGFPMPVPDDMVVLDSLEILRKFEVRSLGWTYSYYFGKEFPEAHRAINDVEATVEIYNEQQRRYELSGSVNDIVMAMRAPYLDSRRKFIRVEDDINICFGMHRDKSIRSIQSEEPSYISWMLENMDAEAQMIIRSELARIEGSTDES